MGRPSKYSLEFRERAVRLVLEQRDEYPSEFEAIRSVGAELGVGHRNGAQVGAPIRDRWWELTGDDHGRA